MQLGCPGETTLTMLDGGDRCSPVRVATRPRRVVPAPAPLDGPGDGRRRVQRHGPLPRRTTWSTKACVDLALANVRTQLPQILAALRGAGGPKVHIVGVGHYDPYLAAYLEGAAGQSFAAQSLDVIARLNETLRSAYAGRESRWPTWRAPST